MSFTRSLFRTGVLPPAALAFALAPALLFAPTEGGAQEPLPPDTIPVDTIPVEPIPPDTILDTDILLPDLEVTPPDTTGLFALEELTVDILRSPMSLEDTPFAVSVLGEEMRQTGRAGASIEEALHGLPGVHVQNRFNAAVGERITIRGFGARSPFGVRGVSMIVDGIPATLPDGQSTLDHLDLGGLGRVEALRGPGSSMYGNAAGGVLIFETRPPADALFRQEVETVQGDHGLRRLQSTTSGSIGRGGYLLSLSRYEFDGFRLVANGPAGSPNGTPFYGGTHREQLNTRFHFPLGPGRVSVTGNFLDLEAEDPGSLDLTRMLAGDRRAMPEHVEQSAGHDLSQGQVGVGWESPLGSRDLDVMVYGIRRDSHNPGPAEIVDLKRAVLGGRAILRSEYQGEAGRVWWAIGLESGTQSDQRRHSVNEAGLTGPVALNQTERVIGNAVFLQAMLPINPILNVLTGVRYDRIRFGATDHLGVLDPDLPDGTGVRTLDSASPSFGFHASFDSRLSAYLNLSTAFETPTTTELATNPEGTGGFNKELEPQVGFTVETGVRGVLSPVLAYEFVYFHTTLHGELTPFELEERPGVTFFENSTRSVRRGFEGSLQVAPSPLWSLRLTYATNDARFQEFVANGESLRGRRVPGLPPRRGELLLRIGPGSWFMEYRAELTSAIPGNSQNDLDARSPSYRLADIRVGANEVNVLGIRLSPFAGVTNVFDVFYNTSVVANAAGGRYFEPGPGRNVYVGGSVAVQR